MKISIIVSTYNGEKYINELMESLLKQTRQADEVLFFDDRSSDKTVDLITEFINKHKLNLFWKVGINACNKGWKRSFMEGIWESKGDIVFPCDQDDIWLDTKLEEMERIMVEYPEIDVLTSNYEAFYDSGKVTVGPEENNGKLIKQQVVQNIFDTKYPGCTYCIRRKIIEQSKSFWESDFPHDALFWRMGIFSDTLYSYNKSLIRWRKHDDSAYALESLKVKNTREKREWLNYALRVIGSLKKYVSEYHVEDQSKKTNILDTTQKWIELRISFYDTKKIRYWFQLLKYIRCYDRFKQYLGDFYLVAVSRNQEGKE